MRKLICFLAMTMAVAMAVFSGCRPKEKVARIALAMPLTGDDANFGQGILRACEMALNEAIEKANPGDIKIEVVPFDDRGDPKEAVNVANRIISDPAIVAVVGHFNSGATIPAASVYARGNLAMIVPGASNPQVTQQQLSPEWIWKKNVFRVIPTDDVQGGAGAEFVFGKLNSQKAAIVHDKTAYGQGLAEEFKKKFESLGGKVLSFNGIQRGDKDFKALLTRIKSSNPPAIYFGGVYNEGALILRQARETGIKATFITGEASYDQEFLNLAGPSAEGSYITFLGTPPELLATAHDFIARYKNRYPNEGLKAYDHYAYEATNIAIESIRKAGADRTSVMEHLRNIHYNGALGETSFDEKGDTTNQVITVFQIQNNQFQLVKKEEVKGGQTSKLKTN